jgi:hypothetical protein
MISRERGMIWESCYWKRDLLKKAEAIEKFYNGVPVMREGWYVSLEQDVMIGFYIVRKLVEALKVTTKLIRSNYKLKQYSIDESFTVHHMNWYKIEEYCDLSFGKGISFDLEKICNKFIHSFVFIPNEEGGRVVSIFFTSDHGKGEGDSNKQKKLYEIELSTVVRMFSMVSSDCPVDQEIVKVDGESSIPSKKSFLEELRKNGVPFVVRDGYVYIIK